MSSARRNVLLSSAGRRVSLLGFLQEAVSAYGGRVVATDMSPLSAAAHRADAYELVPRCTDPEFVPAMLELCERHDIGLVVPTIDTELPALAAARERFAEAGTRAVVAPPAAIDICADKRRTHEWLVAEGLPTVAQASPAEVMAAPDDWSFPLIAKPARGSASIGVRTVEGVADLVGAAADVVVQARAPGHEYTVDVYVDLAGAVVEAVPRRRIEVRAGEVSKGRTERHGAATKVAGAVAERLAELGLRGPMNVQVFCDGEDVNVIEMNPRFGGGYPLAHHAGAHFTQWLVDETIGGKPVRSEGWTEGLVMLRYDAEVIVDGLDDAG